MPRLSDLSPTKFAGIIVSTKSQCINMAEELNAKAYTPSSGNRPLDEIVSDVLERGGVGLTVFERRQLPNLILQSQPAEKAIAFAKAVLKNYATSNRFWGRLFRSWILEYDPGSEVGQLVISELSRNLSKLPHEAQNMVSKYPVLNLSPNFSETVRRLLGNQIPPEELLALGLKDSGVAFTQLALRVLISCAQTLISNEGTESQLIQFKSLVAPSGNIDESVKMIAMVGLVLGAKKHPLKGDMTKNIHNLIEKNFDDPVASKERWPLVINDLGGTETRDLCLDTVRKWQAFRSITLFFKIIEKVVESEHRHHFPIRRDFWLSYFDQGEVVDAWVVLGSKAQSHLTMLVSEGGEDFKQLKWAKLSGGAADQCALLMKLGKTTVMEFSHSGRVRMWGEKDGSMDVKSHVPILHQPKYGTVQLRSNCPPDQMIAHDPNGQWRIRAERCIKKLSGKAVKI
jgi:hypothetical protein